LQRKQLDDLYYKSDQDLLETIMPETNEDIQFMVGEFMDNPSHVTSFSLLQLAASSKIKDQSIKKKNNVFGCNLRIFLWRTDSARIFGRTS
jgi:hypothetical protein